MISHTGCGSLSSSCFITNTYTSAPVFHLTFHSSSIWGTAHGGTSKDAVNAAIYSIKAGGRSGAQETSGPIHNRNDAVQILVAEQQTRNASVWAPRSGVIQTIDYQSDFHTRTVLYDDFRLKEFYRAGKMSLLDFRGATLDFAMNFCQK